MCRFCLFLVSLPARLCTRWAGFGVCGVEVLIRKYYENNKFLFSVYVILQISNSTLICVKTRWLNLFAFPPLFYFLPGHGAPIFATHQILWRLERLGCWNLLARECMSPHKHCELFAPASVSAIIDRQRSGTVSWVLRDSSGAYLTLSPMIKLCIHNPRKKERKNPSTSINLRSFHRQMHVEDLVHLSFVFFLTRLTVLKYCFQ